jgi:phosphoserine phosphatase RsbU/P
MVVDVSRDWVAACDVQQRFLPNASSPIDKLSYSAQCRQVRALGGDFYDFLPLPQNRLALAIGDASGKGLPAALMISYVQSSLRTAAAFAGHDAPAVVQAVNRQVCSSSLADRYATLFYGVFDASTRRLLYVNAGHNPPAVLRPDGSVLRLDASGLPVGIFPDSSYLPGSAQLSSGDLLLAYTDGATESVNPSHEEWGFDRLLAAARSANSRLPDEIVDAVFSSLDRFSLGRQSDDATLFVARIL